jgi:small basic protein (TIGR04137 family)
MTIHPSLRLTQKDKKPRSVLKRTERLKAMMEKGNWKEGDDVYRLPKIKTIRIKIKKEKAAEKPEVAGAVSGVDATSATTTEKVAPVTPQTKEQTTGKGAAKTQEKK